MYLTFCIYVSVFILRKPSVISFSTQNAPKQNSGKENCLHAVNFCNGLILFQKTGWILLVMYLIISFTWFSGTLIAWLSLWLFMFFTVPSLTIHFVLSRPIIFGRFKEFSFEKYHNTKNHHSLL